MVAALDLARKRVAPSTPGYHFTRSVGGIKQPQKGLILDIQFIDIYETSLASPLSWRWSQCSIALELGLQSQILDNQSINGKASMVLSDICMLNCVQVDDALLQAPAQDSRRRWVEAAVVCQKRNQISASATWKWSWTSWSEHMLINVQFYLPFATVLWMLTIHSPLRCHLNRLGHGESNGFPLRTPNPQRVHHGMLPPALPSVKFGVCSCTSWQSNMAWWNIYYPVHFPSMSSVYKKLSQIYSQYFSLI